MIADLVVRPPDPLLKIMKLFHDDPRSDKIDLGVGVYRDERGATPIMAAVKEAEKRLIAKQSTKTYVGQQGDAEFLQLVGELAFGDQAHELVSIQTVGGTGALRLGFDLLRAAGATNVVLPTPSWPNHPAIIAAAGLQQLDAPFFNVSEQQIDMGPLLASLAGADHIDAVLLQACCHNPLGADFTLAQWDDLSALTAAHDVVPFIDLAYQGFGEGIEQDVQGLRRLLEEAPRAIVAVSGAKTFGLYRERVGALFVKTPASEREAVRSTLYAIARANYSMPPDHGAACVREVLSDPALRQMWKLELDELRAHIQRTRAALSGARINALPMHLISKQKGMFSTLPLTPEQIRTLREQFGVYMTDAGRINVAGLPGVETERFLTALGAVT